MLNTISVTEFRDRFSRAEEFAVIDVREIGNFTRAHLLAASNLPLSRLEALIGAAVPARQTEIILTDFASAPRAAAVLGKLGYQRVTVLGGGLGSWALDGGKVFSGTNVIGKAFGEYIEKTKHTPAMGAVELKRLLDSDTPPLLLDTRTPQEHRDFCIPGALSCPNGELVLRALDAIDSDDRLIVAHCAGRTRSIIGAQTLIDTGIPNPVIALENGTLAWQFESWPLERGANRPLPLPRQEGKARSVQAAAHMRDKFSVSTVEIDTLQGWRADSERTLYVFDVRSAEEYAAGSLRDARHVPGGQLVQNVDDYLVTRNARTILVDNDGVRASATAGWLRQLGYADVFALTLADEALRHRFESRPTANLEPIEPRAASTLLDQGDAVVVDIRRSVTFRREHLPDSWYFNRARFDADVTRLPPASHCVLIADDPAYAELVATDLQASGRRVVQLNGGVDAWKASGLATESGLGNFASEPADAELEGEDYHDPGVALREGRVYLEWEIALVYQLANDPGAPYVVPGAI